jgi:hypothetical protein
MRHAILVTAQEGIEFCWFDFLYYGKCSYTKSASGPLVCFDYMPNYSVLLPIQSKLQAQLGCAAPSLHYMPNYSALPLVSTDYTPNSTVLLPC